MAGMSEEERAEAAKILQAYAQTNPGLADLLDMVGLGPNVDRKRYGATLVFTVKLPLTGVYADSLEEANDVLLGYLNSGRNLLDLAYRAGLVGITDKHVKGLAEVEVSAREVTGA